jgi:hypothetical protein
MIWVVEQKGEYGIWRPTVGTGLTKQQAIEEMNYYWKENHPEENFRVKKYISA